MSERPGPRGPSSGAPPLDAGTLGMIVFVVALSMFFVASVAVYLVMRQIHQPWPPRGFPALPASLWLSTADIAFGSVMIHGAVRAARRGSQVGMQWNLLASLALALGFLGLQSYAWYAIWTQVVAADRSSTYLEMFYALTGLHAVHVLGGLGPLAIVTVAAFSGRYSRKKNAAVRYTAIYWHFLAAVWCVIFTVVYVM